MEGLEALKEYKYRYDNGFNSKEYDNITVDTLTDTIEKELKDYERIKKALKIKLDNKMIIFEYKGKKYLLKDTYEKEN